MPLKTHHVYSTLKRRGNVGGNVVSTWNTIFVFEGAPHRVKILAA